MEVKLARTAGFCMGVRLAMDKILDIAERAPGPVYTYGPLIHNRQAVEMLEAKGVRNLEDCPDADGGTVLLRAHGVPREEVEALRERGFRIVDATCPHVLASQRHIQRAAAQGRRVVIAGDKDHAEVIALVSQAPGRCVVVSTPEEARAVAVEGPACLLAQTTFNDEAYAQIAAALRERLPHLEVVQSICRATRERQEEVLRLAEEVDAVVVVGGRHSANTRRLAELAGATGTRTFHVETAADLDPAALAAVRTVGLTAGASTPNWVTRSVLQALEDLGRPIPQARWLPWRALALLARSNLSSALAAAALTFACSHLVGIDRPRPALLLAAFCYVFAVTTLNRVAGSEGEEPYLPPRVAFYRRHASALLVLSAFFALASMLALVRRDAWRPLVLLAAAYVLGVAYSVRLVPKAWLSRVRIARLKDLPASKDMFIGLAWVFVCVLVPWLEQVGRYTSALLPACLFAFVLVSVKAVAVDLADMQEDHLLGRETLPIVLGPRRTLRWAMGVSLGLGLVLAASAALGWVPAVGWVLLACPAYVLVYLRFLRRHLAASDVVCALVTDGAPLLAGALTLLWAHLAG